MNVKWGEGRGTGLLGGLSSSYKGAYPCVTPVGGDEDVEHDSVAVESLNIRLSLATRNSPGDESGVCSPVDSASPLKSKGARNNDASTSSGDNRAFFDFPADFSFFPGSGYALTSPLALAASNARVASSSEGKP